VGSEADSLDDEDATGTFRLLGFAGFAGEAFGLSVLFGDARPDPVLPELSSSEESRLLALVRVLFLLVESRPDLLLLLEPSRLLLLLLLLDFRRDPLLFTVDRFLIPRDRDGDGVSSSPDSTRFRFLGTPSFGDFRGEEAPPRSAGKGWIPEIRRAQSRGTWSDVHGPTVSTKLKRRATGRTPGIARARIP